MRDYLICSTDHLRFFRARYMQHRRRAVKGGIGFELTFREWMDIWVGSGLIFERGTGPGQYVMARHRDEGPYRVGNVSIILAAENVAFSNRNLAGTFSGRWGAKRRADHSAKMTGRKFTPEHRRKISEAHLLRRASQ